jgi:putative SOS response-associated peptidase YedK
MCRRYALPASAVAEREFMPTEAWWKFEERSNVAPSQYVPALRLHKDAVEGIMMRWGLIPDWAEGKAREKNTETVELDDLDRSKVFKMAWLNSQRCILPVAGFYVWRRASANYLQPYFVSVRNRQVFGVAAIWDRSTADRDDVIESCSIITVSATPSLEDAATMQFSMPAILRRKDYGLWLKGTPVEAKAALQTYPDQWLQQHPVSPRINSLEPDDLGLRQPIEPP